VSASKTKGLPPFAHDFREACEHIHDFGLAILPDQLSGDDLQAARKLTYDGVIDDKRLGRSRGGFALDYGDANVRVWNMLNRGDVFVELVQHPVVLELLNEIIGWPALLGNISANIALPGNEGGALHPDQIFIPKPWPERPQGMNCAWLLDDFTAVNGATEVVPGSHLLDLDSGAVLEDAMPVIAPAGSLVVFESRVWHRTGLNRSDTSRAALFAWYTTPIYRPQENWFLSLGKDVTERASDDLLTLLAYKSQGFGLVYGQSPR
jgi:hypothetical protein